MGGTMRLGADPIKLHAEHAGARDLRRGRHLRAPPPPLRGQQLPAQAPRGRRPRRARARRRTSAWSRSSRSPTTRSSSPPSTTRSSSRGPSARRRCSATSSRAALEYAPRARDAASRVERADGAEPPTGRFAAPTGEAGAARPRRPGSPRRSPTSAASSARSAQEAACAERVARRAARRWASRGRARRRRGNLLARIRGRGERTILLCAHLDTVAGGRARSSPVLVDGGWENANDGILGADNKAAVAMILEVARRCSVEGSPVGLELLFTVAEEIGLPGAKALRRRPAARASSATSSTTRPRSARSSPPRRRSTASRPSSSASPPTPASAPRPAARAILAAAHAVDAHAARPDRRRDDRQRRLLPRRRRVHQRRAGARPPARRGPLARPRAGRGGRSPR